MRLRADPELSVTRRDVVAGVGAVALAACAGRGAHAASSGARNLLVLLADDLSGADLGCYGNRDVRTPVLDALAGGGARFDRAYTAVGVCQPSRSSLYTGLYPIHHGALGFEPVRSGVATWPALLGARGVATAMIGKLDVEPAEQFPFEFLVKANTMASRRDARVWRAHFEQFLRSAGQRPFAAMVALVDPHRPFDEDAPARSVDPAAVRVPGSLWDAPGTREELAGYYDCIARLDATVGELLAALEASGHARDTLVIFTADNGASFPFAKSTLYEAGVRMPFLVHGPGVARGTRSELVSLLDLLPTALEMFGAAPVACDGRSLTGVMRGPDPEPRAALVTMQTENNRESGRPARALHGPRFKYIRNFGEDSATVSNVVGHSMTWSSGRELARSDPEVAARMRAYLYREVEELYDLATDPLELRDLARVPEYAATCAALRGDLRAWMERNADPLLAEWPT